MIEAAPRAYKIPTREMPLAFRPEFYEKAPKQQIIDDLTSFLGEYRFEVSEYDYNMRFSGGRLLDPNTGDDMENKAQKAIDSRKEKGLSVSREVAEKDGLASAGEQLAKNPEKTIVWFSPLGPKSEGYGDYGFGFVGKLNGEMLEMTAIRLEDPQISDFNNATNALWGESYQTTESFLRSPRVVDIDKDLVKEFIHGSFEIKDKKTKDIFKKSIFRLLPAIEDTTGIIQRGVQEEIVIAINTLENLAIELRGQYKTYDVKDIFFSQDFNVPDFETAMIMPRYTKNPPPVAGSCGMTGKNNSSNFLGKLLGSSEDNLFSKNNQEWFSCPKCKYKADGPVGDTCPGCRLTKEDFAKSGGSVC